MALAHCAAESLCLFVSLVCVGFSVYSDNSFWFVFWADISALCMYPCLLCNGNYWNRFGLSGFVVFVLVSSLSSTFILLSLLDSDSYYIVFAIIGYCMKFSIYPFIGWSYVVCINSSWIFVYYLFVISKFPWLVFLFYINNSSLLNFCGILGGISLLLISILFWFLNFNWLICWCHVMISSGILILLISLIDNQLGYLCYFFSLLWSCLCIKIFLSASNKSGHLRFGVLSSIISFLFVFISFPPSFMFVYKILMCQGSLCVSWFVIIGWVLYSISEQLYFLSRLIWFLIIDFSCSFSCFRFC